MAVRHSRSRRPWAPGPGSRSPNPAPGAPPKLREAPGVLGNEEKGHRAKGAVKGRSNPVGSPGAGVRTLRAGRGPGSRVAPLTLSLPCPGSRSPSASSLSPPLGPTPLARGSVQGIKRRGGRGEGKLRRKGTILSEAVLSFSSRPSGHKLHAPARPSSPHLLPPDQRGRPAGGLHCALGGARLCPPRPRSPPPAPRLSLSPFH